MSTRACVTFYDEKKHVCSVYHHCDGYPEGIGQELVDYLKSKKFVNGIGLDENVFNGIGCFIAQYIRDFKTGPGGLALRSKWTRKTNAWEEYVYKVTFISDSNYRVCRAEINMMKGRLPKDFERSIEL